MNKWLWLAVMGAAWAIGLSGARAQNTFGIPFNLSLSGTSFSIDTAGTFIVAGSLNESSPESIALPTGPQFVWYPSLSSLRVGTFDSSTESNSLGENSIALGHNASTQGSSDSIAIGTNASAPYGSGAIAIGGTAEGDGCLAIGGDALLQGSVAIAGGECVGTDSIVIGPSTATSNGSFLVGSGDSSTGGGTLVVGLGSTANGPGSVAFGIGATTNGFQSTTLGTFVTTQAEFSVVVGVDNSSKAEDGTSPNQYGWIATDPIFEIGNGNPQDPANNYHPSYSDAVVVYKDGDMKVQGVISASPGGDIPMYTGN